jgi:8-oxo-dGTP diphosphatase
MPAEDKHYVTVFVLAASESGTPEVLEPTKCERWAWFDWAALPEPLFLPLRHLVATGFVPPGET